MPQLPEKSIDTSLKRGDLVRIAAWPQPVMIVDVNWAIQAAAVHLSAPGADRCVIDTDSVVVWPLDGMTKVEEVFVFSERSNSTVVRKIRELLEGRTPKSWQEALWAFLSGEYYHDYR